MAAEITVEIINKKGLHARAAAKFVKIVASYPKKVSVIKKSANNESDSQVVDGASILGLMMLGADIGSLLNISTEDESGNNVLDALRELITNRFGEEE